MSGASSIPRLIVEVCHGRHRGLKACLAAGEQLTVGRTERAQLVVPQDELLGGRHFSVAWDGTRGVLHDEGARGGTLVDGETTQETELRHGAWVRAGQTDFQVFVEGAPLPAGSTLPPRDPKPLPPWWGDREAKAAAAWEHLNARGSRELYGVVDASRHPDLLPLLRTSVNAYRSLFEGPQAEALCHVAPHLVTFEPASALLETLVKRGWGRRWGIFLASSLSFEQTRRHLRRFLMVKLETHPRPVFFRFYDPGVLAAVEDSFPPRPRYTLLGPFASVLFECPRTGAVRELRPPDDGPAAEEAACS